MKYHCPSLKLLLIATLISSGCTVGLRKETRVVYAGLGKQPEEAKGAIRIATNSKIPVTIVGDTQTHVSMDLGGYYVISATDLRIFVDALRRVNDE